MHIRKDDLVEVIAGDDVIEGRARKVLRVLPDKGKVVIEGVNRVYKHVKPNRRNPQGGRLSKEMPINASNCLLYCQACRRGVRIGKRFDDAGAKERYCKKCGTGLGKLAPANPRYAKKS
ncbi:MAG: 50S ribosomal protein L24 [Gemmataceae bacterium]